MSTHAPYSTQTPTAWRLPRTCQACLDGVHLDLADQAGFEASCAQASTYTRPVLLISKLAPSK